MAQTVCGFCGQASHMTLLNGLRTDVVLGPDAPAQLLQGGFQCDNCHRVLSAYLVAEVLGSPGAATSSLLNEFDNRISDVRWFPRTGNSPVIEDVPPEIERAAREAYSSHSVSNNMAAVLMARTVIEATAKAKGITTGSLVTKIEEMKNQNLIRPDIAAVAHEVRHLGNDMAHGDLVDAPSADDAGDVLALMSQVLAEVFQGPALLQRVQARRTGASPA